MAAPYTYDQFTMNPPRGPWNAARADSSSEVESAGFAAGERGEPPDDRGGRAAPAGDVERGARVPPRLGSLEDGAPGRGDEGGDPHEVALVPVRLDLHRRAGALGGRDELVPGDRRRGGIDPGPAGDGAPVPEQLGVRDERRRDEPAAPAAPSRAARRARPSTRGPASASRERPQEPRRGELRDERQVEAHEIERGVARREPPDELLALLRRVAREVLHADPVPSARLGLAARGEPGLAAVVRVHVPGEGGRPGPARAARRGEQHEPERRPCVAQGRSRPARGPPPAPPLPA